MKMRKYFAIFLVLLLLLAGCSARYNGSVGDYYAPGAAEDIKNEMAGGVAAPGDSTSSVIPSNQKLIRTLRMEAETEDLGGLLAQIDARIAQLGGYVESRQIYHGSAGSSRSRYANMTIRVPAEHLDAFADHVTENANVVSATESAEDITLSYVATQSRITALQTEEARLLELLAQAENLEELLIIESRLTDVRTELENVTSQLRLYDNLVDYGTIHLTLEEVRTFTVVVEEEETLWQRIGNGFMGNLKRLGTMLLDLLVGILVTSPYWLPLALIPVVVVLIVKLCRKKRTKQPKTEESE